MLKELLLSSVDPIEIRALLSLAKDRKSNNLVDSYALSNLTPKEFSYHILSNVSRSFSTVIQQLPSSLRDSVCNFYLVLRALDTIEDDTKIPFHRRLEWIQKFHLVLDQPEWKLEGIGTQDGYQQLLTHFDKVISQFQELPKSSQLLIQRITKEMGHGMTEFLDKDIIELEDYNSYCHYVAGLVGIGLSELFVLHGYESESLLKQTDLSNSMGLFLQKTNIVRDYHEDLSESRSFWPKVIWGKYASQLKDFSSAPYSYQSLSCLNEMVCDALHHATDAIEYLSYISNKEVFRFCAIPQIMAMATLAKVYNNPKVFTKSIKIRKGLSAKMFWEVSDMNDVCSYFEYFAKEILSEVEPKNSCGLETIRTLHKIIEMSQQHRDGRKIELKLRTRLYRLVS